MNELGRLRRDKGRDPIDLATAAGISVPAYFDLEARDDELDCAVSVGAVARIAQELGVKPSLLYGGASNGRVSLQALATTLRERVTSNAKTLADFEESLGWTIGGALANPQEFLNFNADGLRAACSAADVDWFDVLDELVPD